MRGVCALTRFSAARKIEPTARCRRNVMPGLDGPRARSGFEREESYTPAAFFAITLR
ncbi:hypothetical protein ACVIU7_004636 [Bradyrhizobium liaoningense]